MSVGPGTIGVLTFHRCINYGSYWQGRCLVDGLRNRGHDAQLLDHQSRRVAFKELRCALRPVPWTPSSSAERGRYRAKVLEFAHAIAKLPLSAPFPLGDPSALALDTIVIGSDEVWNLRHPWYGDCPTFFGEGLQAERLVAYAASFGGYHAVDGISAASAERLRRFDAISVRDENSAWVLRGALGIEPDVVLDPCLQFPVPLEGPWRGLGGPFALVYGHSFSPRFAAEVRRWADARALPLVSIGYRNDWADLQWIEAGPHDFAQAMAGAEAIATNFFHGCVFALRNGRPFVCEVSPYRQVKVTDLMALLGGERHLVATEASPTGLGELLDEPPAIATLQRIEALRRTSSAYLDRALGAPPVRSEPSTRAA